MNTSNDEGDSKDRTEKQLEDAFDRLFDHSPEERLEVYQKMREKMKDIQHNPSQGRLVCQWRQTSFALRADDLDGLTVSEDGYLVQKPPQVFLSHSHEDKPLARSLADQLTDAKIKVWIDEAELKIGDSLIAKLREAIDNVDILIVLLSTASVASPWVQKEVEIAMNQEIKQKRVKVLPVVLDELTLPGFLEGKFYADFTTPYRRKKSMPRLIESIRGHLSAEGHDAVRRCEEA